MLSREALKSLLQRSELTQTERALLCLGSRDPEPLQVRQIEQIGVDSGLQAMKSWNLSTALSRSNGKAVRTNQGWELTPEGREWIAGLVGEKEFAPSQGLAISLRDHMNGIENSQTTAFVEEAVRCFEHRLYRAAVVFSWLGAVAVLQDHVVNTRLEDFNREAERRDPNWRAASGRDDLAEMKEWKFLQVLRAISVIGKSTKHELENCLQRRNGCGHPNDFRVGEKVAAAHLETLIDNVFAKF